MTIAEKNKKIIAERIEKYGNVDAMDLMVKFEQENTSFEDILTSMREWGFTKIFMIANRSGLHFKEQMEAAKEVHRDFQGLLKHYCNKFNQDLNALRELRKSNIDMTIA